MPKVVVFDCNIWDLIAQDELGKAAIRSFVESEVLQVIVPSTVVDELEQGPLTGVPDWFPTRRTADAVFVLSHSKLSAARLGSSEVYSQMKGESAKISDAVIVATADADADYFVSEDRRARNRYAKIRGNDRSMTYAHFRARVLHLPP